MSNETKNPTTHFLVYGTLYKQDTGAVSGLALYRIDDWEEFKTLPEDQQRERFTHQRTDNFGKLSKKHIKGNPGTVYEMEYQDLEEGQYTIYPGTAQYVTRLYTVFTRRWDENDRLEASTQRTRQMQRKDEKLRLRDDMTVGELKTLYRFLSNQKRAALIQTLINDLMNG